MALILVLGLSLVLSATGMPGIKRSQEHEESAFDHILHVNEGAEEQNLKDTDIKEAPFDVDDHTKRNARRDRHFLWKGRRVPYVIDSTLSDQTTAINAAIAEYESKTCLSFELKTSSDTQWIRFFKGSGCWSYVGRTYWLTGAQDLSLGVGCYTHATIVHEIKHALGFYHEQSRVDRDNYIEIFWENIDEGNQYNMDKQSDIDDLGKAYDFDSVMHYGRFAFSKNNQQTIARIGQTNYVLGGSSGLSPGDIAEVNALYDCASAGTAGFSSWSSYGPCDGTCNKWRQRFCGSSDYTDCSGANTHGIQSESLVCPDAECYAPIAGMWNKWSSWSGCSATCGSGSRTRTRVCDDPAPANGGATCPGSSTASKSCKIPSCTLDLPFDCDFENGICNFIQDEEDGVDIIRHQGHTPSGYTGPGGDDHTIGTGHYMYLEGTGIPKDTAGKLIGPIQSNRAYCLSFYYNMYSQDSSQMGYLMIYERRYNAGTTSYTDVYIGGLGDSHGRQWLPLKYARNAPGTQFTIVFVMMRGTGYQSDMAIDDVELLSSSCT